MQLKKWGKGLVAVPEAKLPPLTAEQVRAPGETIADLVGSVDGLAADLSGRRKGHLRTTGYGRKRG